MYFVGKLRLQKSESLLIRIRIPQVGPVSGDQSLCNNQGMFGSAMDGYQQRLGVQGKNKLT